MGEGILLGKVRLLEDRAGRDAGIICVNNIQIALVPACWIYSTYRCVFTELFRPTGVW